MGRLSSDVGRGTHPVTGELALVAEVPLGNGGGLHVGRQDHPEGAGREDDILGGGDHTGEGIAAGVLGPWRAEGADGRSGQVDFIDHGRVGSQALEEPGLGGVIENADAGADGIAAVAVRIPDDADARREVDDLIVGESRGNAGVAPVEHARGSVGIDLAVSVGQEGGHGEGGAALEIVGGV